MHREFSSALSILLLLLLPSSPLTALNRSASGQSATPSDARGTNDDVSTASPEPESPLSPAVAQLRHAAGEWDATTEFLAPDGAVARSVGGTYVFEWVVPDRVLSGRSKLPELNQVSGILFYYEEAKDLIGMAAVGADGHLWVMTGPADREVRTTPPTVMPDGSTLTLRFTRYNVEPDSFESMMEYSNDDGATWTQGNHQVFTRRAEMPAAPGEPVRSPAG